MKLLLLVLLFNVCFACSAFAQIWQDLEIKGGLLYAQQRLETQNTQWETYPETGWQIGVVKNVPIYKILAWEVGLGYSKYRTNAVSYTSNGSKREELLDFGYAFLETGINLRKELGPFAPYIGSSFRVAGMTDRNLDETFVAFLHERLDYGVNFKAGIGFKIKSYEPFLEASIFKGLANGAINNYFSYYPDGTRVSVKDYLVQRFFSIQLGLRF